MDGDEGWPVVTSAAGVGGAGDVLAEGVMDMMLSTPTKIRRLPSLGW